MKASDSVRVFRWAISYQAIHLLYKLKGDDEAVCAFANEGYEAGKQAGIKEVVEWMSGNSFIPRKHSYEYYINEVGQQEKKHVSPCKLCCWQSKLKEWGIK